MRRLPVDAEAVDAGVFGVSPVAQHPELHQLVRAHRVTLGEKGEEKPEPLKALEGSRDPRDPIFFLGSGALRAKHLPPSKTFGWGHHRGCR